MAKQSNVKTPKDRSPKSHMPLPPRDADPHGTQNPNADHGVGEFTGQGQPALEKK